MSGELVELCADKVLAARVIGRFQVVIADSFAQDKSRVTMSETRRRFGICEGLYRDLRALGWSHARILDSLAAALRSKLDGGTWSPEAVRRTWQTDDPEVAVTQITHHGTSNVTGAPYQFTALGVIRVRDGLIVRYEDYMDPIALARLLGRTGDLAAALATA